VLRKIISGVIPIQFDGLPIIVLSPCIALKTPSIRRPADQPETSGGSPVSAHASSKYRSLHDPDIDPPYFNVRSVIGMVRPVGCREDHKKDSLVRN
jgi:hypothetical protein